MDIKKSPKFIIANQVIAPFFKKFTASISIGRHKNNEAAIKKNTGIKCMKKFLGKFGFLDINNFV